MTEPWMSSPAGEAVHLVRDEPLEGAILRAGRPVYGDHAPLARVGAGRRGQAVAG
ncbi:hypothetical protein [Streptomyces sp. SD31]|uniref:hypothetical protein n=1 Tax=Streptomyces sp. SD31 TaxID=3452208 RepID=UPI003F8C3FEF